MKKKFLIMRVLPIAAVTVFLLLFAKAQYERPATVLINDILLKHYTHNDMELQFEKDLSMDLSFVLKKKLFSSELILKDINISLRGDFPLPEG